MTEKISAASVGADFFEMEAYYVDPTTNRRTARA